MKNFEIPVMNISMFECESVATTASGEATKPAALDQASTALKNANIADANTINVVF